MSDLTLSLDYDANAVSTIINRFESYCQSHGLNEELQFQAELVIAEALNNIIKHSPGYTNDGYIQVTFSISPEQLAITLVDWSPAFPPPQRTSCVETGALSGRGWYIIRCYMDKISYTHSMGMNTLVLSRSLIKLAQNSNEKHVSKALAS